MIIGVPKEIKDHESRVGITPAGVKALAEAGHKVLVETHAGDLSAFTDDDYQSAGAEIVGSAHNVWGTADMVVKVKEPVEKEYAFFRPDLTLFTYLHLAPLPVLTDQLLAEESHRHRVRNHPRSQQCAPAADADVRSCGAHVRAGGRYVSGKGKRWPRPAAGRRSGSNAGECLHHRRRYRRHQRSQDRARHGREGHAGRPESEPPARVGRHLQRPRLHPRLEFLQSRARYARGRPRHRRRADSRCGRSEDRDRRHGRRR